MRSNEEIIQILAAWDLGEPRDIAEIHPGRVWKIVCRENEAFILKDIGGDGPPLLQRYLFECEVLAHLHRAGIPVAVPIADRLGSASVLYERERFTLSPFLVANLAWLELDLGGLQRLNFNCGAAIGRLHAALASFPREDLELRTWRTELPGAWFDQCIPAIRQHLTPPERAEFDAILDDIGGKMQIATRGLPEQLIHRDCHHGNIVVNGEQVTGFVDCDHLSLGPRVFDIADFLIHMIKQDVGDPRRTSEWFQLFPAVLQGYEQVNPLSEQEKQSVTWMMLGVLIMFVDWFFKVGKPEKARADLAAFTWMVRNRQAIGSRWRPGNENN